MFEKYDSLNPNYIPNNTTDYEYNEYQKITSEIPIPLYDIKNNLIGYSWYRDEMFDFDMSVNDIITVRKNSLIYNKHGEHPDVYTVAEVEGQQAYNTVDARSWTFVGKTENLYIWVEDEELTYPVNGDKSVIINTAMSDSYIELNIYNFKEELIYTQKGETGESSIVLHIDKEMSKILKSGIYNLTLKICSPDRQFVKSKFIINIK